jgi:urease accessory protein UreE
MPYYIYIVTSIDTTTKKSVERVSEFENFKLAKTEVRRLRAEQPLQDNQSYKIIFAEDTAQAEQRLVEYREEPVAKEWEK